MNNVDDFLCASHSWMLGLEHQAPESLPCGPHHTTASHPCKAQSFPLNLSTIKHFPLENTSFLWKHKLCISVGIKELSSSLFPKGFFIPLWVSFLCRYFFKSQHTESWFHWHRLSQHFGCNITLLKCFPHCGSIHSFQFVIWKSNITFNIPNGMSEQPSGSKQPILRRKPVRG